MSNHLNIDRFCAAMSKIFSDKYGCEVTFTATPKDAESGDEGRNDEREAS